MDIEKAFDSLDHNFLISATGKYGFSEKFISCIKRKVAAKKQESCVLNDGKTTKYFLFGRDTR